MTLKESLLKKGKKRWLDIGSGGNFEEGFWYLDTFPEDIIEEKNRKKYTRLDLLTASEEEIQKLGKFDLVRMQHTLEHFSFEEGLKVLETCSKLLKKGGIILITVPDLQIHIQKYLKKEYKNWEGFSWWAHKRIPKNAPQSFYFSIFAYSMPYESHKWAYDFEGLKYLLQKSGFFQKIKELKTGDKLASDPFTHNRPEEDLCVIAVKK